MDENDEKSNKPEKKSVDHRTERDFLSTLSAEDRDRFLFIYKVITTASLLIVVGITYKYGIGPGLIAAALHTLVF